MLVIIQKCSGISTCSQVTWCTYIPASSFIKMVGFFTVMSQCFFDVGLKSSSVYCSSSANLAGESKHPCNSSPYRVGWIGEAVVGLAMLGVYTYVRMYVSNIILC